ncbi:MAG: thioredoxin domain-containing protein [Candidatus Omnitrophica bacterium]|nr:thioredoxin domain-containing protein [Candidatus Omnitrophota bacterium]
MEKKRVNLIFVSIIGIFIMGSFVSSYSRSVLLKKILKQQTEMMEIQDRIKDRLVSIISSAVNKSPSEDNFKAVLRNQEQLKQIISGLKSKSVSSKTPENLVSKSEVKSPPEFDYTKVYDIPIDHSPIMGDKNAPITFVVFLDFRCGYASEYYPLMVETKKKYPDKVNYVVKNFPLSLDKDGKAPSKAAFAAGEQGKYFEMVEALLKNRKNLNDEKYKELAEQLGMDIERFWKDYKDKDSQWEEYIKKDLELGKEIGVRGVPMFYINGLISRGRDIPGFKKEIDLILKDI